MNKQEFVEELAERTELSKADAGRAVNAIRDSLTEVMADGEEVSFTGFGKFLSQRRRGREAVNPHDPSKKNQDPRRERAEVQARHDSPRSCGAGVCGHERGAGGIPQRSVRRLRQRRGCHTGGERGCCCDELRRARVAAAGRAAVYVAGRARRDAGGTVRPRPGD